MAFGGRSLTEEWIDNAGPFRDVVISLLASLAKQERVRIQERVRAGLERAKVKGTKSGRAIGRPKAVFDRGLAKQLRQEGMSLGGHRPQAGRRAADGDHAPPGAGPGGPGDLQTDRAVDLLQAR